jgi:FHS family L-fucose permease-like MFS transporter
MQKQTSSYLPSLVIIGVLFFIFGYVTWANGILIPFFKSAFELNNAQSYLVTFAFFISYTVMALPSAALLRRTGYKRGMSYGLATMAVGALLFIPAAQAVSYPLFLLGLFVTGLGLTVLQTASNPYAAILGPPESGAQRISFMGIANKTAGIISQLVFGSLLLAGAKAGDTEALQKVTVPYIIQAVVLIALALLVLYSSLPDLKEDDVDPDASDNAATAALARRTSVYQFPHLLLGVLAIFLYVGVEVIAGDTIINYGQSQGIPTEEARFFTSYTLYGMLAGYIIGIITIPRYVSQQQALRYSAILGIVFSLLALFTTGFTSVLCIALLGLANALMWPAIFPLAIAGLGRFTKTGSALLIMGIAGGAILPFVYGALADRIGEQQAYWILLPGYLYILYYAIRGHKVV